MQLPKIVDNKRKNLSTVINEVAKSHRHLSIATGYWDLPGLAEVFENIKDYESIRLLIGQEPLPPRYASKLDINKLEETFPELDFKASLSQLEQRDDLRSLVTKVKELMDNGQLQVKVYRRSFLHAKAYVFGNYESDTAVGIIGSSNFTRAGLTSNTELNALEDDHRIVKFKPHNDSDEYGHLSWFDSIWEDELNEDWNGTFTQVLQNSAVGDMTFGPYDTYIKTLMEMFPEELDQGELLSGKSQDILYSFQNRNAGILIRKLEQLGTAILSDSVGLGKTITAGAVIQHYVDKGAKRIIAIVPASLKAQWRSDLADVYGLIEGSDFKVISQQDVNAMDEEAKLDRYKQIDLFIVDEAHNLRNTGSSRYDKVMGWFQDNPDSRVLMLTATPINNSLNDLVNQIQLGLKGQLDSIPVPYYDPNRKRTEMLDFFDALSRIQKRSNNDPDFDWESVRSTLVSGIQHYLVRSTRQGVEAEGALIGKDGEKKAFPKSFVDQVGYNFTAEHSDLTQTLISENIHLLEGIDPTTIDIEKMSDITQRSSHPLDFIDELRGESIDGVVPNIFQMVTLMGLTPYKPMTYRHEIYGKTPEEIRNFGMKGRRSQVVNLQLTLHNMLFVTWLKRLESSTSSLLKSIETYGRRLEAFKSWLDRGYVLSFGDIDVVEREYGEDIEKAFDDYEAFENIEDETEEGLKRRGIERKPADPEVYNIDAMFKDIERDINITKAISNVLSVIARPENDVKLQDFARYIEAVSSSGKHGQKVLVFSFFADTINYLEENLKDIVTVPDFVKRSAFSTGKGTDVENQVRRFSPKSKKYEMQPGDQPIDYLFATDVLSEGQNLQDAAILVNYDLHWNPVRMIQRNGRVNRLGSEFDEVIIANMKPEDSIELYLNLVARLQKKIDTIKHTVGLDQGILSSDDVNPMEFIEDTKKLYSGNKDEATKALEELGEDDSILSWTNDHIYKLREFLVNSSQEEIDRIRDIPNSKWSYLPMRSQAPCDKALSLLKVDGRTSITNHPISLTFFVETLTDGEYISSFVDEFIALQNIQTTPEDNERLKDEIVVDRQKVERRSSRTAERRAMSEDSRSRRLKPHQEQALEAVQSMYDNVALRPYFENNINDARTKRRFESVMRRINSDLRDTGSVNASTLQQLNELIAGIKVSEDQTTEVDRVVSVLNYAKRRS